MNLIVASQNPVKVASVEAAVEELWPNIVPNIIGASIPSGVSAQPMNELETHQERPIG